MSYNSTLANYQPMDYGLGQLDPSMLNIGYQPPKVAQPNSLIPNAGKGLSGLEMGSLGLSALSDVGNMYNQYQNNKLNKKKFGATLAFGNRGLADNAKISNERAMRLARLRGSMQGLAVGSQGWNDIQDRASASLVDGSPITV